MKKLFYILKIVSVEHETVTCPTAVVACFLKIYHKLQYCDILRIFLMQGFMQFVRVPEMLLETSKKFTAMVLQSLEKVQSHQGTLRLSKSPFQ